MATSPPKGFQAPGPYRASDIAPGDPYEVSNGHRIECMPTGGRGAGPNALGAAALGSDPNVVEIGVDPGYSPNERTLRAPDIGVGLVPNQPGWIHGVPPLAVEYADIGQDEDGLQEKIRDFLRGGTRFIWVVRLTGPRRVDVYERGRTMYTVFPGHYLEAAGILKNPVLVEALYDRNAAHEATLRNLLQSKGYENLDAVLEEGRQEGREEGRQEGRQEGREKGRQEGQCEALREAILDIAALIGIELTGEQTSKLQTMNPNELRQLKQHLKTQRAWPA